MFFRVATLLPVIALAAVAAAAPRALEARDSWPGNTCSTGNQYCCDQQFSGENSFKRKDDSDLLSALVGVIGNVGVQCNPITVIGVTGGTKCNAQAACCTDTKQDGLVNIACTPISAGVL